jgi:hypothetical protein
MTYCLSYIFLIGFSLLRYPTTSQVKFRHILKIHPVYHIL